MGEDRNGLDVIRERLADLKSVAKPTDSELHYCNDVSDLLFRIEIKSSKIDNLMKDIEKAKHDLGNFEIVTKPL